MTRNCLACCPSFHPPCLWQQWHIPQSSWFWGTTLYATSWELDTIPLTLHKLNEMVLLPKCFFLYYGSRGDTRSKVKPEFPIQSDYFSLLPMAVGWGLRNQSLLVSWLVFHSSEITSANTEQQFHPAEPSSQERAMTLPEVRCLCCGTSVSCGKAPTQCSQAAVQQVLEAHPQSRALGCHNKNIS